MQFFPSQSIGCNDNIVRRHVLYSQVCCFLQQQYLLIWLGRLTWPYWLASIMIHFAIVIAGLHFAATVLLGTTCVPSCWSCFLQPPFCSICGISTNHPLGTSTMLIHPLSSPLPTSCCPSALSIVQISVFSLTGWAGWGWCLPWCCSRWWSLPWCWCSCSCHCCHNYNY